MHARALLFDMDGTLIDSSAAIRFAWKNWADRHGFDGEEVYHYSHGRKAIAIIAHFAPTADLAADARRFHDDIVSQGDGISAIPGAKALLGALRPDEWAVVTSAPRALAEFSLTAAGLPLPSLIVGADQVSRGKPDPEGFALGMRELGVEPAQTIVFEDAEAGLIAGRAAGGRVVGVGRFVQHRALADAWINDYADMSLHRTPGGLELALPSV